MFLILEVGILTHHEVLQYLLHCSVTTGASTNGTIISPSERSYSSVLLDDSILGEL